MLPSNIDVCDTCTFCNIVFTLHRRITLQTFKLLFPTMSIFLGIVSKLTVKFWLCQKFGKTKYYSKKKLLQML
jgi:restriction endonuclease